jgi:hypothetical protein
VSIKNGQFVDPTTGDKVLLVGANAVFKGPPWLPSTDGTTVCDSADDPASNTSCAHFNAADATHLTQDLGYNLLRLGVTWAGGQPNGPNTTLDADFVARLHAILDLAHAHGIAVVLDLHQDAVGTAVCGEGVPWWFSAIATPDAVGKPLWPTDGTPFPDGPLKGKCGRDDTETWAEFAGDVEYNIKNRCCRVLNQGNWGALTGTVQAQETMAFLFGPKGRTYYADYTARLAAAVDGYPAAIAIELMNEPPAVERWSMYETWRACHEAIRATGSDIAVGVMDTEQAALDLGNFGIHEDTVKWLQSTDGLFYAFHYVARRESNPPSGPRALHSIA